MVSRFYSTCEHNLRKFQAKTTYRVKLSNKELRIKSQVKDYSCARKVVTISAENFTLELPDCQSRK